MIKQKKLKEAIKLIEYHNEWRRSGKGIQVCPTKLGLAIDLVASTLTDFLSDKYVILKKKNSKALTN